VVKVRRPGIEEQIALDLELLHSLTSFAEGRSNTARLLQLKPLAEELEAHLRDELDFVEEAHGTELIAGFVAEHEHLVVPAVIHPYVTERVMVLERIDGEKVSREHRLDGETAEQIARELLRAYVQQITVHGVYHADPHRGNFLLTPDGRLALLDFGLIGRIDEDTRRTLGLLLLALAQNRAEDVGDLILGLSLTSLSSDEAGFVHDLRRKLPRYHLRSLAGIRVGEALADLQRIALAHSISLPTSFSLVGKTLSQADSVARVLDPELNPIDLLEEDGLEVMLQETERRLEPANLVLALLHAARAARANASAPRAARLAPRDGHAEGGRRADRPRRARAPGALGRQQVGGGDHHRRAARRLGADGARERRGGGCRFRAVGRARAVQLWRIFRTPGDL
ncbi:MAG: AarF/ABC1/UbiB kinase family protein, partial [Actinobacteria bacterium]|nr:AarF/ABC1/UbiB kinase family protein [Actinomycetota bacterium]